MNARFSHPARGGKHPAQGGNSGARPIHDDSIPASITISAGHACCCPARPVVRVTMPPTDTRRHTTELLLCGHHYRVSREALAAVHATVTELPGMSPAIAMLPDIPEFQGSVR
jgi:hypothetical protein